MSGTHDVAWSRGSRMLVVNTNRNSLVLQAFIRDLLDRQVDSIIVLAAGTRAVRLPAPLPVPTMLINCFSPGDAQPCVLPDERAGGEAQVRMVLDAGHRRIALVAYPFHCRVPDMVRECRHGVCTIQARTGS